MDIFEFFNIFSFFILTLLLFLSLVFLKKFLFWLYLWQLKEYYVGRFLDHFSTAKGRELLFNKVNLSKLIFIFILIYAHLIPEKTPINLWLKLFAFCFLGVFFIYAAEGLKTLTDFFQKTIKKPAFTKKIVFLFLILIITTTLFFYFIFKKNLDILLSILIFDLFIPFFVSIIVLSFQPLTILGRNQIIKKAKEKREKLKNLLVIGITGSYGKTSTKEFLHTILSSKFKVLSTPAHQNTDIAISKIILEKLKEDFEIFIVEMAAYKLGEIRSPCQIVKPKIGIITGVNEQHLSTFGTMENLISAEGGKELIESLPKDGLIIFNGNNKYCFQLYKETNFLNKKICYNKFSSAGDNVFLWDLWAENLKIEKEYLTFKIVSKTGESAEFRVNLLGAQNVENILLAACCAQELGMSLKEIAVVCEKIKPEQGGLQLKKGVNGLNIIDATYSANPDGVISHLEYLKIWPGKKIIIMPCLIELGKASKEVHKKIGQKVSEVCDLAIITTKERFKEIKDAAGDKALFLEKPKEIFEKIKSFCIQGDVILLESRVPKELVELLIK